MDADAEGPFRSEELDVPGLNPVVGLPPTAVARCEDVPELEDEGSGVLERMLWHAAKLANAGDGVSGLAEREHEDVE